MVSKIQFSNGRVIEYWYDGEERITRIADSCEGETFYTYDALGQLTSETKNVCPECCDGETVNITYDNYGNILTKGEHTYGYNTSHWKDKLISFDGKLISYDPQGNPLNYLGHALRWEKGRQLKSFDGNTYTYNSEGIRISKTVDNVRHDYVVDGAKILKETWQDNVLIPIYNNDEEVIGIYYNCEPYYFYKNLQGDVIGIANADGTEVVTYTYDAWGVCTVLKDDSGVGLANINPYRYRSYYYDVEIGMYYLQSRYYDPVVGRFINSDESTLLAVGGHIDSHNYFQYCNNCPTKHIDSNGNFVISMTVICVVGGALILGTVGGIGGYHLAKKNKASKDDTWKYIVGGIGIGAALGALAGYFLAPVIASATGISGISVTKAGIVALPHKLTGQGHHVISNKILTAVRSNPSLKSSVSRSDSIVKAWSKNAHNGYQTWHRNIDNAVVEWLARNPQTTLKQFGEYLYNQYCTRDMIKRFGEDVLGYIRATYF